jgi:hypothetical protein
LLISNTNNKPYITYKNQSSSYVNAIATTAMVTNQWYFLLGSYNGSHLNMYVNGILENSTYAPSPPLYNYNGEVTIGWLAASNYFNGTIDEVMIFNRSLTQAEITNLYNNQSQGVRNSGLETDSNLVSYYKLDELSGTSASDSKGTNTGTLTGYPTDTSPAWNSTGGYDGSGAYRFDGVNDYINLGKSLLSGSDDFTINFWVKSSGSQNTYVDIISQGHNNPSFTGFVFEYGYPTATSLYFTGGDGSNWYGLNYNYDLESDFNWHYLSVTKNGRNLTIYKEGVPLASTLYSLGYGTHNFFIGKDAYISGREFNGTIDNVQIFNRALSADEILAMYNGTLANKSLKYSANQGDFKSLVFYNSTQTYWNVSLSTADTRPTQTGIVNADNSINLSNPNLVSYWALDGNTRDAKCTNITASGGTIIYLNSSGGNPSSTPYVNGYTVHTFTSNGTFTLYPSSVNTEVLIVAGGGGGGNGSGVINGGGGGAGGLTYNSSYPI